MVYDVRRDLGELRGPRSLHAVHRTPTGSRQVTYTVHNFK